MAFSPEKEGIVRIQIFDARVYIVRTPVDDVRRPNHYVEYWDGRDAEGRTLAHGVYFCEFEEGSLYFWPDQYLGEAQHHVQN